MYTWFRKGKAAVTSGSDIVRFTGATLTTDPTKPVVGDAFTIDGISLYEIVVIDSDNTGEFIKLQKPYAAATNSNVNYAIIRLASSTQNNKLVAMAAAAINQKQISLDDMYEWYTSEADTVDFLGPDDSIVTIKTYHKLTQEISDVGGNAGAITIVATNIDKVIDVSNNMSAVIAATASATQAASSASAALASKNAAESSATAAASSASSALTSKNAAATSEANALTSKNAAASSATAAATSATNAANSATAALASKNAAATSETNAASSASSALASKNAAAISETNAAASAFQSFAMSQAQFESIRAQNNEEFAASGFVHFGKHHVNTTSYKNINEGLWTDLTQLNLLWLGKSPAPTPIGVSKIAYPVLNIAGVLFNIGSVNTVVADQNMVKFPQAPDGKTTYNKSTGTVINHDTVTAAFNAQAADPTNVEVVTDRVDMWGFEAWLEEVNTTNPYIYPNGLIQSRVATMDGINTSASARPVTYYAVFDGDTGSKGSGLNFFALTDAQKKKVLANPKNNLYYLDDGRLVQWRLRQRTIAGAGNGDWLNVEGNLTASNQFKDYLAYAGNNSNIVAPKGASNVSNNFITSVNAYTKGSRAVSSNQGIFIQGTAGVTTPVSAVNGECYFLVCGTVNRLNQGAYHPSFNSSGARKWQHISGDTSQFWYEVSAPTNVVQADCFSDATSTSGGAGKGYRNNTGYIGGSGSGRPDGRFYDAIYADGQGGVCRDMRYSAYGVDSVDFAKADQRVKNGTYRGFENTKFSLIAKTTGAAGSWDYLPRLPAKFVSDASAGDVVYIQSQSGSYEKRIVIGKDSANIRVDRAVAYALDYICILETTKNISIGGSFLQTDVIGNPANILATPQLANGWQGSWIPVIPDGTSKEMVATRKNVQTGNVSRVRTQDNGTTWISDQIVFDYVKNSNTWQHPAGIQMWQYQAFAKQTENAANAVVYGGHSGVGVVQQSSDYRTHARGALMESLLGLIPKNNTNVTYGDKALTQVTIIVGNGLLPVTDGYTVEHQAISLGIPVNSSPAFKALNYNVNLNQQANIQYAYTELKHNGTNWGDNGKITIVDNQSTKKDLNGNTVLVGTAKLKEPIGWIKQKV